ncbi:hypothetical protein RW71_04412 [Escherichia coli]|uniref:hypothetical protein n=1 Tax=Escherichia coli TaxID=562 RepID=UPI000B946330|nr:hypothetical protein [Escherichia coli]OXZ49383.1 hypothetical protein RW71_04412 [Escherichia coli]OXZ81340.1 hypothetical protein RW72_04488 [Escherichia coli]
MKLTPFTEMATSFRGHIVRLWMHKNPGSQSETAAVLTEEAIRLGFITRSRPIPGSALNCWVVKPDSTPLWAAQTALSLMLSLGWRPEHRLEWCGLAALLFRANRKLSLDELLLLLPDSIDRRIAAGWFAAAIEEDAHYRACRKTS